VSPVKNKVEKKEQDNNIEHIKLKVKYCRMLIYVRVQIQYTHLAENRNYLFANANTKAG
jgi:hypothetical protein